MKNAIIISALLALSGCATINNVNPAPKSEKLEEVCIVKNPRVKYEEAVSVIRDSFSNHGISTSVVDSDKECPVVLTYTARRSWHFASYLGRFELHLWKEGKKIASAEYAQRHWDPTKWGNTRGRMEAVVNNMLAEYPKQERIHTPR